MNMDLRFDDMVVDTTLAQNYIQTDGILFKILNGEINNSYFNGSEYTYKLPCNVQITDIDEKLCALADKLKEKTDLIAQLEYYYRNIPIEDTKSQLNVIIKQIHYISCYTDVSYDGVEVLNANGPLIFYDDSPLLMLGFVGRLLLSSKQCYIHCKTHITVAVLHLFVKLCCEAGLKGVGIDFQCYDENKLREDTIADLYHNYIPLGANGVISEHSDINSAVDVFITSSLHVPWRLHRILVQESVYQQFKDAITWKCNLKQQGDKNTNTLEYNGRRFLIDPVESTQPLHNQVIVEAYRTTKELISLLRNYQLHYLSLWTNDIAESNEIAHSVSSPVVWVNSFGDFRGPPKVSEAIFSHILYSVSTERRVKESDLRALVKVRQTWLKLDLETRRNILCKGLLECATIDATRSSLFKKIKKQLQLNATNTFVDVGNDYVCTGISVLNHKMYATSLDDIFNAGFFLAVLHGNAFADKSLENLDVKSNALVEIFKRAGVPIISFESRLDSSNNYLPMCVIGNIEEYYVLLQRIKVIWSNSGTIFAN